MAEALDPDALWLLGSQGELRGEITGDYAKTVCQSQLRGDVIEYLGDGSLLDAGWDQLTDDQREELADACYVVMLKNAPQVLEYELEQDFGPYPAFIRGVAGCYFLDMLERDTIGPFSTIELAKKAFEFGFGELKREDNN